MYELQKIENRISIFYIFAFCSLTNRQNIYIIDAYTFMRGKFTDKNLTQQTDGQNIYRIDAQIC